MKRRDFIRWTAIGAAGSGLAPGGFSKPAVAASGTAADGDDNSFAPLGSVSVLGAKEAIVDDNGTTVYVAASDGFAIVDVSTPAEPEVLASVRGLPKTTSPNLNEIRQVYDLSIQNDTLVLAGPAHHGVDQALIFYDVSTPTDPVEIGTYLANGPVHNVELHDGVAYLATISIHRSQLEAVQVEGEMELLDRWDPRYANRDWSNVEPQVRQVHDVTIRDDTAYVPCWDAGTWILDVSDPEELTARDHLEGVSPGVIRENESQSPRDMIYELPGNHHYAVPVPDSEVVIVGREAWESPETSVSRGLGGITLYDMSQPQGERELASIDAPETPDPSPTGVLTTAHNFGVRDDRLYTSWYRGGVRVYDISTPADPVLIGEWADPSEASFWTAVPFSDGVVASSQRRVGDPKEGVQRSHATADAEGAVYVFPEPSASPTTPSPLFEEGDESSGGVSAGTAVAVLASAAGLASWQLFRRRQ